MKSWYPLLSLLLFCSCDPDRKPPVFVSQDGNLTVVAAMRDVMFDGKTSGQINLDTIVERAGLYGLGPAEYLRGELLILDGQAYRSEVVSATKMKVEATYTAKAPFFVYTHQDKWKETALPGEIHTLPQLVSFIDEQTTTATRPFVFKLSGPAERADIHVQNLPKGVHPSSPEEAHIGQTSYRLTNREVDIVGFFSTHHQGIFTHHDSYGHLHLITRERDLMGHLDGIIIGEGMRLFLSEDEQR